MIAGPSAFHLSVLLFTRRPLSEVTLKLHSIDVNRLDLNTENPV